MSRTVLSSARRSWISRVTDASRPMVHLHDGRAGAWRTSPDPRPLSCLSPRSLSSRHRSPNSLHLHRQKTTCDIGCEKFLGSSSLSVHGCVKKLGKGGSSQCRMSTGLLREDKASVEAELAPIVERLKPNRVALESTVANLFQPA